MTFPPRHNIQSTIMYSPLNLGGGFFVDLIEIRLKPDTPNYSTFPYTLRAYVYDHAHRMNLISLDLPVNSTKDQVKALAIDVIRNHRELNHILNAIDNERNTDK